MLLRAFALLAALAIPLLWSVDAVTGALGGTLAMWGGPILAALCTLPILYTATEHRGQAVLGAALAAMATGMSPEVPELLRVTGDEAGLSVHDLREAPLALDAGTEGDYVALRGYLRQEWVVDEYAVASGQRPDQNERAQAVLLPLLGTQDATVADRGGVLVVARVDPERLELPDLQVLRGRLAPVSPEIGEALFAVQGGERVGQVTAPVIMLDTFDLPTRGQALTRMALAVGAALLALVLLLTAIPKPEGEGKGGEGKGGENQGGENQEGAA